MGRPSKFTPEIAATICERLAAGEPLRAICREEGMPQWQTVYRWMEEQEEFSNRIAHARETGYDAIAEEALAIADTPVTGTTTTTKEWGDEVKTGDMLEHRKLQVHTRLQLLAKWSPKKYGDFQRVEHSGSVDIAQTILDARKRAGGR